MIDEDLRTFLNEKVVLYNQPQFIEQDPIQIPHLFSQKEDIEISGFLTATISWGNRAMIIKNAKRMIHIMGSTPFDFVMNYSPKEAKHIEGFVHRTFNAIDLNYFIIALQHLYKKYGGLEPIFSRYQTDTNLHTAISKFKELFFSIQHPTRTTKHLSDPLKNSAAKRIHMMLRWFCRQDKAGVDLGIWKQIPMYKLSCPLDIHSGNIAREFGLLSRKQNDLKALNELDSNLRQLDPKDPVKYDYALFGLGISKTF